VGRTSRWDRPPAPRDLRWFVRLVGTTLIVIGLLMFGFVAYQLWGTGIEYARAQDRAQRQFDELMAAASEVSTTAPSTTNSTPTTSPTTTQVVVAATAEAPVTAAAEASTSTSTSTSTTTSTIAPTTTVAGFDVAALDIDEGEPVAWLRIPRIGLDDIVVAGVGRDDLKKGPGHYPQTPMPGQLGNSAIAGHRTTFGGPFLHVDELEPGDEILINTPYGEFVYVVTGTEIVNPDQWEVIATTDPTVATLTLTSCHPVASAAQRIIVHADLDLARSDQPGQAVFNYGRDAVANATGALPGADDVEQTSTVGETTTTTPATSTAGTAAVSADSVAGSSEPSTSAVTTSTVAPPVLTGDTLYSVLPGGGTIGGGGGDDADTAATETEDAFGNHWFTDSAAWPQVALWGALSAAIAVGAYQLAKRFRNSWIGLAAGTLPFLVALYFFYQNVNRLLPAAL
jgi:sortase A